MSRFGNPYIVFEVNSFLSGSSSCVSSKIHYPTEDSSANVWSEHQLRTALENSSDKVLAREFKLALKKLLIYKSLVKKLRGFDG